MKLKTPAIAIAWEIWARHRAVLLAMVSLPCLGAILIRILEAAGKAGGVKPIGYAFSLLAMLAAFSCFHFTEGQRKGGFGGFPIRLFNLPVTTRWLVALPMAYGSAAVVGVYLLCVLLIFAPLGMELPLLWPSLYLVFGLTQFQFILWSFPENRYLKLFLLCLSGCVVAFGWMFFLPNIYRGTLSAWGYAGNPDVFIGRFFAALALTGPAAYGISLHFIRRQRHGRSRRARRLGGVWEWLSGRFFRQRAPFTSADRAIFFWEWRRAGWILPIVVLLALAMTFIPSWLAGGAGEQATLGFLTWSAIAPFLFASIIGRGLAKPDFWRQELGIPPFQAILPMAAGGWVFAKLKAAFASALVAWAMTFYLSFTWVCFVGDLEGILTWRSRIWFYYSPAERWGLLLLLFPSLAVVTWRLLIGGMAVGLSGRKSWHYIGNLGVGLFWIAIFVCVIWRSDNEDHPFHLFNIWPWIEWLPFLLTGLALAKIWLAALAWNRAIRLELVSVRAAAWHGFIWLVSAAALASFVFILCRNTLWLRHLLMLGAILLPPLAGPALAMLAYSKNRNHS